MRRMSVVSVLLVAATVWPAPGRGAAPAPVPAAPRRGLEADFNGDGFADLAVGVAGETVGAFEFAGAVNVLPGSAGGPTGAGGQPFTQDSPGMPDSVEFDDFFGEALASDG